LEILMIRLSAVVLSICLSGAAFAQTAPAPQPQQGRGSFMQNMTPEQRAQFDADRTACRTEVAGKTGDRRTMMRECMLQRNPQLRERQAAGQANRRAISEARQACSNETANQRMTRDERQAAMRTCMIGKRPEMAKAFNCMDQAKAKNLQPGPERRTFMQSCIRA
jgi:hypothetical protein